MTLEVLTLAQTARAVGRSPGRFMKDWPRMVREQGFPLPVTDTKPWCWARVHVAAWQDRKLPEALRGGVARLRGAPEQRAETGEDATVLQFARALDKEYGGAG